MVRANHIVWIAWQRHLRNETMAERIGADLHQLESSLPRLLRYVVLSVRTTVLLIRNRKARAVVAQNPSIVLSYLVVVLGRLLDMQVAIDAHNAALDPPGGPRVARLAHRLISLTPLTIVTNDALAERIRAHGGRPVVVPDPLPRWDRELAIDPNLVTVICGWGRDEPIPEILGAAAQLPGLEFAITGRPDGRIETLDVPGNVRLTGRLDEAEYIDNLARSAVVVDLTTREDCLVCGATEALAVGRPMVLSDTAVLRARFGPAARFATNEAGSVATAIEEAMAMDGDAVTEHRSRLDAEWPGHRETLLHDLARARRRRVRTWNLRRESD